MLCFFMDASLKEQALSGAKGPQKVRVPTRIFSSLYNPQQGSMAMVPSESRNWSSSSCYPARVGQASCARPTTEPQESDFLWPEVSRCNSTNTGKVWFLRSQGWGGCAVSWGSWCATSPILPQSHLLDWCSEGCRWEKLGWPWMSIFFSYSGQWLPSVVKLPVISDQLQGLKWWLISNTWLARFMLVTGMVP